METKDEGKVQICDKYF